MASASQVVVAAGSGEPTPCTAHLVPCELPYTGSARVGVYFRPQEGDGCLDATFRGRQLRGRLVPPPEGYRGAVLQDTVQASVADGEERRWLLKGTFDGVAFWKHDDPPLEGDSMAKCMRWASIADVLHADHAMDEAIEAPTSGA